MDCLYKHLLVFELVTLGSKVEFMVSEQDKFLLLLSSQIVILGEILSDRACNNKSAVLLVLIDLLCCTIFSQQTS
jgi:hypothetical protein